jgi:hypothetical protein
MKATLGDSLLLVGSVAGGQAPMSNCCGTDAAWGAPHGPLAVLSEEVANITDAFRLTANMDVVRGCKSLGNVEGIYAGLDQVADEFRRLCSTGSRALDAVRNATVRMRQAAVKSGAKTIFLLRSTTGDLLQNVLPTTAASSNQLGEAPACPASPAARS